VDSLSAIFDFRRPQDTVGFVSPEAGAPKVEQKCTLKRFYPPNSTRPNSFHKIISCGGLLTYFGHQIQPGSEDNLSIPRLYRTFRASYQGVDCTLNTWNSKLKSQNLKTVLSIGPPCPKSAALNPLTTDNSPLTPPDSGLLTSYLRRT
jgi:hypothetical protein